MSVHYLLIPVIFWVAIAHVAKLQDCIACQPMQETWLGPPDHIFLMRGWDLWSIFPHEGVGSMHKTHSEHNQLITQSHKTCPLNILIYTVQKNNTDLSNCQVECNLCTRFKINVLLCITEYEWNRCSHCFFFFFVQPLSGAKDRPHNDSDYS